MKGEVMEESEPVSPTGQYFNSSALCVGILGIFESEIPIDDSQTMSMLQEVFLPVNPRFSSVMVKDEDGRKHWKRVMVKLEDHINTPVFPAGLSPESYDGYVQDYLTKIAMEQLPQSRPLWDIHIIKYPTSNAAGTLVIKLHHAMGDGFSLMGAIFSCVKRADDPSLPLTFPSQTQQKKSDQDSLFKAVPKILSYIINTASDFAWSVLKSSLLEDDKSPVRSGLDGTEFLPINISTVTFDLQHIRKIKTTVGGTINDVITGIVFYGIQLYMEKSGCKDPSSSRVTALVLLNTRNISGYQSVEEMTKPGAKSPWGNQFGFLHVALPLSSSDVEKVDPLNFISKAKEVIKRKRSSLAVHLTGRLLELMRRTRGPELTASYIHTTLRNTSMTISNLIGPIEKMGIANHPCRGMYFMVVGVPQSLTVTLISYNGKMRLAMGSEKGFINSQLLVSCMENAFSRIFNAALSGDN